MKLYDDIINKCLNLLENTNMTTYKKKDISSWDIENEHKIILRSDMAYELGGMMMPAVSALAFTSDIDFEDESGKLTLNVGNFKFYENYLQLGINLRIPINTSIDTVTNLIDLKCQNCSLDTYIAGKQNPLYVPKDNYLVKTLCDIFNKMTNSNSEPIAIGGGTYARAFKNCVSFGANFPGDTDMCHQANEFIDIDKLMLSCKIYAETIYELTSKEFDKFM